MNDDSRREPPNPDINSATGAVKDSGDANQKLMTGTPGSGSSPEHPQQSEAGPAEMSGAPPSQTPGSPAGADSPTTETGTRPPAPEMPEETAAANPVPDAILDNASQPFAKAQTPTHDLDASGDASLDAADDTSSNEAEDDQPTDLTGEELAALVSQAVSEKLEGIEKRLGQVQRLLREKDETISSLYSELQSSREGIDAALLRPLFKQIIRAVEAMDGEIENADDQGDSKLAGMLDVHRTAVMNALVDSGLVEETATDLDASPKVDTRAQEIRKVIDADPEMHQQVAKVVMPGFSYGGQRIIRERVDVFRRSAPQSKTDS